MPRTGACGRWRKKWASATRACSASGPNTASSRIRAQQDPRSRLVAKVEDIVGLYVDPPEKALVLSVDEKSQIQALDRTQPGLLKKGRAGR